jgi:hypothetical protein
MERVQRIPADLVGEAVLTRVGPFASALLLVAVLPGRGSGQAVLWQAPGTITLSDWIWGAGGQAKAPKPPFDFIDENLKGTNPKVRVLDANGHHWTVKFGGESHSEVFAARLLFAMGYAADPSYFVRSGVIAEAHGLKRAKPFIGNHGEFAYARFKLSESRKVNHVQGLDWSWSENPFVGTHELNGLKLLIMLMSNWDAKDSRDGKGSNTAVYARMGSDGDRLYYAFDDWGSTFGKWGGFFSRDKWNAEGYSVQTRDFARIREGKILWGYSGKHDQDITSGISVDDVRWLLAYLSPVTDEELRAGLRASGATEAEIETYVRSIRERIAQLQRLAIAVAPATAASNQGHE